MKSFIRKFGIFITSLAILCSIFAVSFSQTLFKEDFMKAQLDKTNLYSDITIEIKRDMKQSIMEDTTFGTALESVIDVFLDTIITQEAITKEVDAVIDQIYEGKDIQISGEYLTQDYVSHMQAFLKEYNVTAGEKELKSLIDPIVQESLKNVVISDRVKNAVNLFYQAKQATDIAKYAAPAVSILLILAMLIFTQDKIKNVGFIFLWAGIILAVLITLGFAATVLLKLYPSSATVTSFINTLRDSLMIAYYITAGISAAFGLLLLLIHWIIKKIRNR